MAKINHAGEVLETDKVLTLKEVLNKYHNIFLDRYMANELDLEYHKRIRAEDPKKIIMEGYDQSGRAIKTPINELIMRYLLGLKNNFGYLGIIEDLHKMIDEKNGAMLHTIEEVESEILAIQEAAKKPAIVIPTKPDIATS